MTQKPQSGLDLRLGTSAKGHSLDLSEWADEDSIFLTGILWLSAPFPETSGREGMGAFL